jgi:hypothetical protein
LSFHFLPLLPALLPSLPSSLQHLLATLAILCYWKYPSGSSSCQVQLQLYFRLHRMQLSSTNLKFNFWLYFRTSQASTVFYQLPSSILSCTSGILRLKLSSSIFSSSIVTVLPDYSGNNSFLRFFSKFNGCFFRSFYLVINI